MRNASIAVLREIGVDTGGSNVPVRDQSRRWPHDRHRDESARFAVFGAGIQGNRFSNRQGRGQAAQLATRLMSYATKSRAGLTPASFEPTIDYVVTKIPRFAFEKFPQADPRLTDPDEVGRRSDGNRSQLSRVATKSTKRIWKPALMVLKNVLLMRMKLLATIGEPRPERLLYVADAFRVGLSVEEVYEETGIDPWFLHYIAELIQIEARRKQRSLDSLTREEFKAMKARGLLGPTPCYLMGCTPDEVRDAMGVLGVRPVYKRVDTCAAEFATNTAYMYSTYDDECEAAAQVIGLR
jgi:carbamoyl-phosphate synthase large subunit